MKDNFRNTLVMKLICSKCGSLLNMSYDKSPDYYNNKGDDEPTGAEMVSNEITVHPCECTSESQNKLDQLKDILGTKHG